MTVVTLRLGSGRAEWFPMERADGRLSATFNCPMCGLVGTLEEHTILVDGSVQPSVQCQFEGCSWSAYVKLEGWEAK